MSVMYVIVPIALLVVLAAVVAYLWAARHGQFDDLTTPAMRVLHDDPTARPRGEDDGRAGPEAPAATTPRADQPAPTGEDDARPGAGGG